MPPSRTELYAQATRELEDAWGRQPDESLPPSLSESDFVAVAAGSQLAPRYGLVTQILVKLVLPSAETHRLAGWAEAPASFSGRSLAKNVVVPFDAAHEALLGGSTDPYVSNPLRTDVIDESLATDPGGQWAAMLRILTAVDAQPELARRALSAALDAARARQLSLRSLLEEGLSLQEQRARGDDVTELRNELFHRRGPAFLEKLLPDGLRADGGAQVGTEAEIPWVRAFSPDQAPSAQEGWYLVYLFSADGTVAYLVLMQGVTHAGTTVATSGSTWARDTLGPQPAFDDAVDLKSQQPPGSRPDRYERAAVYAKAYERSALPSEEQLRADLQQMLDLLTQLYADEERGEVTLADDFSALTLEAVLEATAEMTLRIPDGVAADVTAALRAGKHVLLTGPPGTGKTSLAQAVATAAARLRLSNGTVLTTGTSDWTASDTVGGYWPDRVDTSKLQFRPGAILAAIDAKKWAIVDELNRADIDKAIGQLFTTLSGQPVVLPFEEELEGAFLPVSIVPHGAEVPIGTSPHRVPEQWRVIATLNTRDRDLLFTLSYALMRRFAVIDVPVPLKEDYIEILKEKGDTGSADADARIQALLDLPFRKLGPAILLDVAAFVRQRLELVPGDVDAALAQALLAFVLPQLDDLTRPQQSAIVSFADQHLLKGWSAQMVGALMGDTFHSTSADLVDTSDAPIGVAIDGDDAVE